MALRTYSLYENRFRDLGLVEVKRVLVREEVRLLKVDPIYFHAKSIFRTTDQETELPFRTNILFLQLKHGYIFLIVP